MKTTTRHILTGIPLAIALFSAGACTHPNSGDSASIAPGLTNVTWELQQIQFNNGTQLVPDPPQNYTATFLEEGELIIQADCNRGRGNFTVEPDKRLNIMVGATTRAACPPGSISDEFLAALGQASGYFFRDGNLFIDLQADTGTIQFAADRQALAGTSWQLKQIQFNDGTLLTANPPENYVLEFSGSGEVFVQADCNRAIGQFSETGDRRLSITMGPTTLAACSPESIGTRFLQALNDSNSYFFQEDGNLIIEIKFDSGSLQFTPLN